MGISYYDEILQPTYRGAVGSLVVAADTKSFFAISGSATKAVHVKKIRISGPTLTAVAYNSYVVNKYSSILTGGTASDVTKVPIDSAYAASTVGLLKAYTAVPTDGTLVGAVASARVLMQATTAAAAGIPDVVVFDFTDRYGDGGIVLHGTAQYLGVNFPSAPASAVTLAIEVEWSER